MVIQGRNTYLRVSCDVSYVKMATHHGRLMLRICGGRNRFSTFAESVRAGWWQSGSLTRGWVSPHTAPLYQVVVGKGEVVGWLQVNSYQVNSYPSQVVRMLKSSRQQSRQVVPMWSRTQVKSLAPYVSSLRDYLLSSCHISIPMKPWGNCVKNDFIVASCRRSDITALVCRRELLNLSPRPFNE